MKVNLQSSIGYLIGNQICLQIPRLGNDVHKMFMWSKYKLTEEEHINLKGIYDSSRKEYITQLNKLRFKHLPHEQTFLSYDLGIFKDLEEIIEKDLESFKEGIYSACWDDDFFEYSRPEVESNDEWGFIIKFKLEELEAKQEEMEEEDI